MPPQPPGFDEALTTAVTPVFVVVSVEGGDVPLHVRLPREPGRTEGPAVRPLSRMDPHVIRELPPRYEPGRAHLAPVGLHAIVGLHMYCVM